jgi:uncharacterized phosphosugar-binding protein
MAERFKANGLKVVAIVSLAHAEATDSKDPRGVKLQDVADVVLDTGAPAGDAMISIPGLKTPVAPGSSVGGCILINSLKALVAQKLTEAGAPPTVLTGAAVVGPDEAAQLFEAAYDEHARRLAGLFAGLGAEAAPND